MLQRSCELLHQGADCSTTLLLVPDGEELSVFICKHTIEKLQYIRRRWLLPKKQIARISKCLTKIKIVLFNQLLTNIVKIKSSVSLRGRFLAFIVWVILTLRHYACCGKATVAMVRKGY